jgi:hypothetical protein
MEANIISPGKISSILFSIIYLMRPIDVYPQTGIAGIIALPTAGPVG